MTYRKRLNAAAVEVLLNSDSEDEHPPRKRLWVRNWVANRNKCGASHQLLNELRLEDKKSSFNFLRMNHSSFQELSALCTPFISKQDTTMRKAISACERLALTLRCLATLCCIVKL